MRMVNWKPQYFISQLPNHVFCLFPSDHPRSNHRNINLWWSCSCCSLQFKRTRLWLWNDWNSNLLYWLVATRRHSLNIISSVSFTRIRLYPHGSSWMLPVINDCTWNFWISQQDKRRERQQLSSNIHNIADYLPTKKTWNRKKLIIHYHFESGTTAQYRQEFRRLWQTYYVHDQSRVKDVKLIVGTRNEYATGTSLGKEEAYLSFPEEWLVDLTSP